MIPFIIKARFIIENINYLMRFITSLSLFPMYQDKSLVYLTNSRIRKLGLHGSSTLFYIMIFSYTQESFSFIFSTYFTLIWFIWNDVGNTSLFKEPRNILVIHSTVEHVSFAHFPNNFSSSHWSPWISVRSRCSQYSLASRSIIQTMLHLYRPYGYVLWRYWCSMESQWWVICILFKRLIKIHLDSHRR
jgi:hypothetical protein